MSSPDINSIKAKLNTISNGVSSNNGFITQIKAALVDIKNKLSQVVRTRTALQDEIKKTKTLLQMQQQRIQTEENKFIALQREKADLTQQIAKLQQDLQTERGNGQRTMQQIQELNAKLTAINAQKDAVAQRLSQYERNVKELQDQNGLLNRNVQELNELIDIIRQKVNMQTRLLDPANRSEDPNLFYNIDGINQILTSILSSSGGDFGSGTGPGPDMNFGNIYPPPPPPPPGMPMPMQSNPMTPSASPRPDSSVPPPSPGFSLTPEEQALQDMTRSRQGARGTPLQPPPLQLPTDSRDWGGFFGQNHELSNQLGNTAEAKLLDSAMINRNLSAPTTQTAQTAPRTLGPQGSAGYVPGKPQIPPNPTIGPYDFSPAGGKRRRKTVKKMNKKRKTIKGGKKKKYNGSKKMKSRRARK